MWVKVRGSGFLAVFLCSATAVLLGGGFVHGKPGQVISPHFQAALPDSSYQAADGKKSPGAQLRITGKRSLQFSLGRQWGLMCFRVCVWYVRHRRERDQFCSDLQGGGHLVWRPLLRLRHQCVHDAVPRLQVQYVRVGPHFAAPFDLKKNTVVSSLNRRPPIKPGVTHCLGVSAYVPAPSVQWRSTFTLRHSSRSCSRRTHG